MAEIVTVTPVRWLPRGEALADRPEPIAIWSGIPGEKARVRVEGKGQHRWFGSFVEATPPHPTRVEPSCGRYKLCGGCPLMHVDGDGQIDARRSLVRQALDAEGLRDVGVGAWHASPMGREGFRHVVKLGFGRSDRGNIRVGAWSRGTNRIVPIPQCDVAAPILKKTMNALAHHTIELDIWPWEPESGKGALRAAVLRASHTTGEVLVTLVVGGKNPRLGQLAEALAGSVSEVVGVWLHHNDEPGNSIFTRDEGGGVPVARLVGKATIEERLGGVSYDVGPGDFFQTNPAMAEVLYARTIEALGLEEGVPLVDLYSGVGGLALPAAKITGWALGVEEVEGAVVRARESARRQQIPAEFVVGQVFEELPELARRLAAARPVVAVNPARRGLEPGVIEGILSLDPRRVGYVSCNPQALAADLAVFVSAGFTVRELELFDMFPHTPHVEVLAVLEAPSSAPASSRAPRRRKVGGA